MSQYITVFFNLFFFQKWRYCLFLSFLSLSLVHDFIDEIRPESRLKNYEEFPLVFIFFYGEVCSPAVGIFSVRTFQVAAAAAAAA